jgi:cyanate lyase
MLLRQICKRSYAARSQRDLTVLLMDAKKQQDKTFAEIGEAMGRSEVWVASLFFQEAMADEREAEALAQVLELNEPERAQVIDELTSVPIRAAASTPVPQDPFVYRLYEVVQSLGFPLKAVANEKFPDDGIMSAIDFRASCERKPDPNGDRVVITLDGKFLPYRKY